MIYHHHHIHTCMYILICHVTFFCPPKDFAQATALLCVSVRLYILIAMIVKPSEKTVFTNYIGYLMSEFC